MVTLRTAAVFFGIMICAGFAACGSPYAATNTENQSTPSEDLAQAKDYFVRACAVCHGVNARGEGVLASQLVTPPSDLTLITQRAGDGVFPAKRVYETIEGFNMPSAHGTREMPVWGAVILFEELGQSTAKGDAKIAEEETRKRLKQLVAYLRSIQQSP